MEPEKENKENKYDIKTTVNALHDSGIDIMEGSPRPLENEFSTSAPPKLGPAAQTKQNPVPVQPAQQERPSAQSIIDAALGMGSVDHASLAKNDPSIKPLRTFKSDAEEAVKYNNVSKITIAVAEQKRKEEVAAAPQAPGAVQSSGPTPIEYVGEERSIKAFVVLLVLGILLAAGTGAYYWFFMRTVAVPAVSKTPKGLAIRTPIAYDDAGTVSMEADKDPLAVIGAKLASTNVPIGSTYALFPLPAGTTTVIASPASLFKGTHMPDRLSRSIAGDYMVGTYFFNSNSPFIVLKNTFFQNAFAGMLDWEKEMRNDLIPLIRVTYPDEPVIDTGATVFSDLVVSNVDARILKNQSGKVIVAYAFTDKDTLAIATNVETLKFVIDKLLAVRVVQ